MDYDTVAGSMTTPLNQGDPGEAVFAHLNNMRLTDLELQLLVFDALAIDTHRTLLDHPTSI